MTRIVTGQDLIHKSDLTYSPDRIWWSESAAVGLGGTGGIWASDVIADGSVVYEVQIQAAANALVNALDVHMWLSIVHSERPTAAEVMGGDRLIDWRYAKTGKTWMSVCLQTNERWPMRRVLHGSHMRFAFEAITTHVGGAVMRVSVLYSPG